MWILFLKSAYCRNRKKTTPSAATLLAQIPVRHLPVPGPMEASVVVSTGTMLEEWVAEPEPPFLPGAAKRTSLLTVKIKNQIFTKFENCQNKVLKAGCPSVSLFSIRYRYCVFPKFCFAYCAVHPFFGRSRPGAVREKKETDGAAKIGRHRNSGVDIGRVLNLKDTGTAL